MKYLQIFPSIPRGDFNSSAWNFRFTAKFYALELASVVLHFLSSSLSSSFVYLCGTIFAAGA
jgi:hypothetical protein